MSSPHRRAVFTCLGLHSPIGLDPDAFWQSLLAGRSGIHPLALYADAPLRCRIGGEIREYDSRKFIPASMKEARKAITRLARTVQLGVSAAQQAMSDGGPARGSIDPFRFGIEFACVMVSTELEDVIPGAKLAVEGVPLGKVDLQLWGRRGLAQVPPLWMLKYLPNMPACHASINADAQGPNNTHTPTDVASLHALGEAFRIIQRGGADFFLVGGCESKLNPLSLSRTNLFAELTSSHNQDPERAVRPFDADRDGTVLGEGSSVVGLEELTSAQARDARIYAELVGYSCGYDRGKSGRGLARVIQNALHQAGVSAMEIDHVNVASGGWRLLDAWEARAIQEVFGENVPAYSVKPQIGHSGAAAGLLELSASLLAMYHGLLPATLNHDRADPDCPVRVHTGPARAIKKPCLVKISFTDAGQCAAAVIRRWN